MFANLENQRTSVCCQFDHSHFSSSEQTIAHLAFCLSPWPMSSCPIPRYFAVRANNRWVIMRRRSTNLALVDLSVATDVPKQRGDSIVCCSQTKSWRRVGVSWTTPRRQGSAESPQWTPTCRRRKPSDGSNGWRKSIPYFCLTTHWYYFIMIWNFWI